MSINNNTKIRFTFMDEQSGKKIMEIRGHFIIYFVHNMIIRQIAER